MKANSFYLALVSAATLSLAGCTTSHINGNNINSIPASVRKDLASKVYTQTPLTSKAVLSTNVYSQSVSFDDLLALQRKGYANLPGIDANLYLPSASSTNAIEGEKINTQRAGYLNSFANELADLESHIPDHAHRLRLVLGTPSKSSVSPSSGKNQLTREDGLLAIDINSANTNDANFFITEYQKGALGKNEKTRNAFSITFGSDAKSGFNIVKKRSGLTEIVQAGNEVLVGGGVSSLSGGFLPGAAAMASLNAFEYGWAYIEAFHKVPEGTSLTQERTFSSNLPEKTSTIYSTFQEARDLGATDIICAGKAIIYAKGAKNVHQDGNTVYFESESTGANLLTSSLYHAFRAASVIAPARNISPKNGSTNPHNPENPPVNPPVNGVSGGEIGGPGVGAVNAGEVGGPGVR